MRTIKNKELLDNETCISYMADRMSKATYPDESLRSVAIRNINRVLAYLENSELEGHWVIPCNIEISVEYEATDTEVTIVKVYDRNTAYGERILGQV